MPLSLLARCQLSAVANGSSVLVVLRTSEHLSQSLMKAGNMFSHMLHHFLSFYPRDAMLAGVFATAACVSVRHAPVLCQNEES